MSQANLFQFFKVKKGNNPDIVIHASKRIKLHSATEEKTTAASDDHHGGSPCRPTKTLVDKDSEVLVLKRDRDNNAVKQDLLKNFDDDDPLKSPQFKVSQLTVPERFEFGKTSPPGSKARSPVKKAQAPSLLLPKHFKELLHKFESLDTIVSIMHKRNEICTFSKVKDGVQQSTGKTFTEQNLGQIATVYPSAYTYRQEKVRNQHGPKDTGKYQLTLDAQFEANSGYEQKVDKNGRPQFSATHLRTRIQTFRSNLLSIVKEHHKSFLSSLPCTVSVPDQKLTHWHTSFRLVEVPEIKAAPLPQPPNQGKKLASAREVLETAKSNLQAKIQQRLDILHSPNSPAKVDPPSKGDSTANATPVKVNSSPSKSSKVNCEDSPLKGVSASLLEKIRAKEARRAEAAMMKSTEEDEARTRLERLPELARILRIYFVNMKKPCLLKADVIEKLAESYKTNLGKVEAEKHLSLLLELVPDWLNLVVVNRGTYIKLDKNKDVSVVVNKLQGAYQKAM